MLRSGRRRRARCSELRRRVKRPPALLLSLLVLGVFGLEALALYVVDANAAWEREPATAPAEDVGDGGGRLRRRRRRDFRVENIAVVAMIGIV